MRLQLVQQPSHRWYERHIGAPSSLLGGGLSPMKALMAIPAGSRRARVGLGDGLMTRTQPGVPVGLGAPGVEMVGGGRPVATEGVRPDRSEAELEAVESVRAGIGGSLSMLGNIGGTSCSRAEGKQGKWKICRVRSRRMEEKSGWSGVAWTRMAWK